jgi:sterol desaturase/sphingolipid hydroxylase (fatty acid hydroxylase superfamily)
MIWQAFFTGSENTIYWIVNQFLCQVPWQENYLWGLTLLSIFVASLELFFPWRTEQRVLRQDFWLDGFYMYFNFFGVVIILEGLYSAIGSLALTYGFGLKDLAISPLDGLSLWIQLPIFFLLFDFLQWGIHILLHRVPMLWAFHKVHHSVFEMGFSAHLRYHWVENLCYKPAKLLILLLLGGVEPKMAVMVHFLSITIGHLNHANLNLSWGIFGRVFNSPVMHLVHHAKELPVEHPWGMNFGISFSLWDYLFGTNYLPEKNPDLRLGFAGDDDFPRSFYSHLFVGIKRD